MKIEELAGNLNKNVDIEGEIVDISEPREVTTRYGSRVLVSTAKIKDDTGSVNLTLWGKQIDEVKVGDKIKIVDGFVKEFNGEIQVTLGRKGKIMKI